MAIQPRRIAVLTAGVGEGHLTAAQVLAEQVLELAPDVEVVFVDALEALGPVLRLVLFDAYRFQLRRTPWIFQLLFSLFHHVRPLRSFGRSVLSAFGGRRLGKRLAAIDPDVVVSTYPAATSVLGSLRRRGRVTVPAVATITDFAGISFWSHRGIDLHLVPHRSLVPLVEREAGRASAQMIAPLAHKAFRAAAGTRSSAREELGLSASGRVVVVTGGGWGVGDVAGAVAEAATLPNTTVVAVAGHNELLHEKLEAEHAGNAHVRVLGFTATMPQLLAAADALVHTTGGVTCLEALTVGCPIVAYGAPAGHAPSLARAMAKLQLAAYAKSRPALREALIAAKPVLQLDETTSGGALLLCAQIRVQPRHRSRLAIAAATSAAALLTFLLASSRTAFAVISSRFDLAPAAVFATHQQPVGLVVDTTPANTLRIVALLARRRETASFAFRTQPTAALARLLAPNDDSWIIVLSPSGLDDWVGTANLVEDSGAGFVLAPRGGMNAGQYVMARLAGATVIVPAARLQPGAVVLWRGGSLGRVLAAIERRGLTAVPVGMLAS